MGVSLGSLTRPLAAALLLGVVTVAVAVVDDSSSAKASSEVFGECRRVKLSPVPSWVFSGAWSPSGEELMLLDASRRSLLAYDPSTGLGREALAAESLPSSTAMQACETCSPSKRLSLVSTVGEGYVVEVAGDRFQRLTADLETAGEPKGPRPKLPGVRGLHDVDSWVTDGRHVLMVGDYLVHSHDGNWLLIWAVADLVDPDRYRIVHSEGLSDAMRTFYNNRQGYLAVDGGRGYSLLPAGAGVLEVDLETGRSRHLDIVPRPMRTVARLPRAWSTANVVEVHEAFGRMDAPLGLAAQDGRLYLLGRQVVDEAPSWTLTVVDLETEQQVATLHLPTQAEDLVMVPGRGRWALVEKEAVRGLGQQPVPSAVVMPAAWFAPGSPLQDTGTVCR